MNRRKNLDCKSRNIRLISSGVTSLTLDEQIDLLMAWASQRLSRYICVANVHMLMEAYWNTEFNQILDEADLVTADGMPLVILMKLLGARFQNRVAGMDIFLGLCERANASGVSIFFLGSQSSILSSIQSRLSHEFPSLTIAGMLPLPFREMTSEEEQNVVSQINKSGAGLLFVALGCPKQERWISKHRGDVQATMIGLGAVFSVYAGIHKHAPLWMRSASLEWLYRLIQEPKRLWRRYYSTIPIFLLLAIQQLFEEKFLNFFKPKG